LTGYYVSEDSYEDFSDDDDISDQSSMISDDSGEEIEQEKLHKGKRLSSSTTEEVSSTKKSKQSPKGQKESPKKTGDANSCAECKKTFSTPESLTQHKTTKHGTPPTAEIKKKEEGKKKNVKKDKAPKSSNVQKLDTENGKGEEKKSKKKKKKKLVS